MIIKRRKLNLWERLYLPAVIGGFKVTLRHFFKKKVTMQYPEERWVVPEGYRGAPYLVKDQDGRTKCVSCQLCEFVCPPKAIRIMPPGPAGAPEAGNNDNNTSASYNAVPPNYVAGPNGVGVVNFTGNGYLDNLAFSSQTPADLTVFLLATASTNLGGFSAWMAFNQSQSANDWQTGLNIDQGQYPSTTLNRLNVEGAKGGGLGGFQLVNGSFNFGTYYVFEIDYGGGPANNHSLVTALVGGASVASRSESPNAVALNNFYLGTRADVYGYN